MTTLGIDIGGTSVKVAATADGKLAWVGQSPTYDLPSTEQLVTAIRAAISKPIENVSGVGICAPGLLDRAARRITLAVNVPGLVGIKLDDLVSTSLGSTPGRVEILNDAVATAADIFASRKLRGRLLVLALGTGVGAAVLDDGVPLIVEGESPGHIGQIDVSVGGEPIIGPDGGAGGLEGYIGAAALAKRYGREAVETFTGDEPALRALVRAVRICHAFYRPDHVCLTGGIGIRLKRLLPKLRVQIETHLTSVAKPEWTFTCGDSDFHAALGAARMAAGSSESA